MIRRTRRYPPWAGRRIGIEAVALRRGPVGLLPPAEAAPLRLTNTAAGPGRPGMTEAALPTRGRPSCASEQVHPPLNLLFGADSGTSGGKQTFPACTR